MIRPESAGSAGEGMGGAALARLVTGQTCLHACMAGMRMASPLLALRAGYSAAAVGVLLALFALTQVFLALPAGRYTDRHGLKRPVFLAVLVAAAGAGMAAAFPVFPVLCLAALCTGGATGVVVIAMQRHVGRSVSGSDALRHAFSWLSIGPAIANFIGPFVAGLLIDHAGFRLAFGAMAMLPLATWWWLRPVAERVPQVLPKPAPHGAAWSLMREPAFSRLMLVNWVLSSSWDVHTFVVPLLGHERDLSASAIGAILGSFAVAAALVRMALPVLARRLHEWQVILFAMVATAVLFGVYPLMHAPLAMGLCSVLLGLSLGAVQPMVMSTLHHITPEHRHGEALALRLMAINASSVAMPMLFGALGAALGVSGVFWVMGAVAAAGTRLPSGLRPQEKPQ